MSINKLEESINWYNNRWGNRERSPYDDNPVYKMRLENRLKILVELVPKRGRVLVIGTGRGYDLKPLIEIKNIDIVAGDISIKGLKNISFPIARIACDGCNLCFTDESFDCVYCSEVIEHIPEAEKLVSEMHRVLKNNNGELVLSTPNWISLFGLVRKSAQFILNNPVNDGGQPYDNWYTFNRLKKLLSPYFEIEEIRSYWHFPPTGKGKKQLPYSITVPIIKNLLKVDEIVSKRSKYGCAIALRCSKI